MNDQLLIDSIYEAAFAPDVWGRALDGVAAASRSASASMLVYPDSASPPHVRATSRTQDALRAFVDSGAWRTCPRMLAAVRTPWRGFRASCEIEGAPEAAADASAHMLAAMGLEAQINAMAALPTGGLCGFTMERDLGEGPHTSRQLAVLNDLLPHFARACLVAARLGLEAARSAAHAFGLLGLPAAAIRQSGVVVATNALFDRRDDFFVAISHGRLALRDQMAGSLLRAALEAPRQNGVFTPMSIPLRGLAPDDYAVLHVFPLRRSARDIFVGADVMIALTEPARDHGAPEPPILTALFDLTASEARLCVELARGASVRSAAATMRVTHKTVRTYLDRIFLKTGVHSQIALIAMLRGLARPGGPTYE